MISTGNDIVALQHMDAARVKKERFYSQIISGPQELALYCPDKFAGVPLENFIWLLWSIKESAYKYQKRNNPSLLFSPRKITVKSIQVPIQRSLKPFGSGVYECTSFPLREFYASIVHVGTDVFYARSIMYHEFVYTVVSSEAGFGNTCWGIQYITNDDYTNQSKAVRAFVLNKFSSIFPGGNITINKHSAGYPVVYNQSAEMDIPLSFTHHGNFIAYSFVLGAF